MPRRVLIAAIIATSIALGCSAKQLANFDRTQEKICEQLARLQAAIGDGTQDIPDDRTMVILGLTYRQALFQCAWAAELDSAINKSE